MRLPLFFPSHRTAWGRKESNRMGKGMIRIAVVICVAFTVSAAIMWAFINWLDADPVVVAGFLGMGYASNHFFNPPRR